MQNAVNPYDPPIQAASEKARDFSSFWRCGITGTLIAILIQPLVYVLFGYSYGFQKPFHYPDLLRGRDGIIAALQQLILSYILVVPLIVVAGSGFGIGISIWCVRTQRARTFWFLCCAGCFVLQFVFLWLLSPD